jgi:LysM repeat protein
MLITGGISGSYNFLLMKLWTLILFGLAVLSACAPDGAHQILPAVQLTPFSTNTPANQPTEQAISTPPPTPLPTATPLVHVVAIGETISSIALRYGLDTGAVLAANPDINPNALTAGSEVIVPLGDSAAQIGTVSEPLSLTVETPVCASTFEGGLHCLTLVRNPLDQPAAEVAVAIKLLNSDGSEIRSSIAPLLMSKIDPGQKIPVVAYFAPPVSNDLIPSAGLISAIPASESGYAFLPTEVVNEQVELKGQIAEVFGEVDVSGEPGKSVVVRLVAAAYDENGRLVGARRTDASIEIVTGDALDFSMTLFSNGGNIARVAIFAEAYQVK